MISLFKFIFGSRNDRLLKQYKKQLKKINALEDSLASLSDEELRAKTQAFRERYHSGESLDDLLPEAFAVCREASKRVLGMRHFDVQMIGGMALHYGKIAEMRTGEGKTLVATLPVYLNALSGKGVHVVTVNDYLASRDAQWMGQLYRFLGLTVGINLSGMQHADKQRAYASDITYGTNNEYGFDYLRDNMVQTAQERVQRGLNFAIIDEVDSILIDEARTPLIISGPAEDRTELYLKMNAVPDYLEEQIGEEKSDGSGVEVPGDFVVDHKSHQVYLTESGHEKAEKILVQMGLLKPDESLYAPQNISLMHHLLVALKAKKLYLKDQQYVVKDGEVIIVDEFTGRLMQGRRWADGIHQAVEAKEGVRIQTESQTMATITFQNYFRMYEKLAGMTGTADTEAYEFLDIYGLETVIIPTNRPSQRKDELDQIYKTEQEKYQAILRDIQTRHANGQPILVGTTSIENSELLSKLLNQAGLKHSVLNAKQHEKEAEIVAQAGKPGMITIATNMAGRGTDIVLGGNVEKQIEALRAMNLSPEQLKEREQQLHDEWEELHKQVLAAGGLHIIGTERHESRRIDNQLRGRAGRQGDPGSSRFYLSLDDPLMKIFAGDMVRNMMDRLNLPEGEAIEAKMVTRAIESAQRKVEARNYEVRKNLLEFDNVSNEQRQFLYRWRNEILEAENVSPLIGNMRDEFFTELFRESVPEDSFEEQWDLPGLEKTLSEEWHITVPLVKLASASKQVDDQVLLQAVLDKAKQHHEQKISLAGETVFSGFERAVLLQQIDNHWREHLASLDHLRQGVYLRSYAQKDPKQEFKKEGFALFSQMLDRIRDDLVRVIMTVRIESAEEVEKATQTIEETEDRHLQNVQYAHASFDNLDEVASGNPNLTDGAVGTSNAQQPIRNTNMRVGRNDPCPCGSGKKYKQCHGSLK